MVLTSTVLAVHRGTADADGLLGRAEVVHSSVFVSNLANGDGKSRYVRVDAHVELHIHTLFEVVHHLVDAVDEVLPSAPG